MPYIFTLKNPLPPLCFTQAVGVLLLSLSLGATAQEPTRASEHPGAAVYQKMCADCHGKQGEGVHGKYEDPLAGNRTIPALTRLIAKTMPEGKEGTCVGPDAENVAAYIYDAFYSPTAQAKLRPVQESL